MRLHLVVGAIMPICLLVGGCVSAADSRQSTQATVGPSARGAPISGPSQSPNAVGAQPSPAPAATIDVTPAEVPVGTVTLSLALEPARHMQDEGGLRVSSSQPQPAAPQPTLAAGPPSQGALVLSDMVHVTNNLDPTQPAPPDAQQSIVRHSVVEVVTANTHQLVPYLNVTMDLLLDGHPVNFGQTLVPMLAQDSSGQRLYYGNNVRLPQRGTFQVFIRVDRTPLLGQDAPPAAQFNLVVR